MNIARIVVATVLTPLIAVMPYLAFAYYVMTHQVAEGGAPAQGVLVFAIIALSCAVIAMVFLGLARLSWRTKGMVVRQHLFGWPMAFSCLFLLLLAVPSWFEGFATFLVVLLTAFSSAGFGLGATSLWLRFSYPSEEANQPPETRPTSRPVSA